MLVKLANSNISGTYIPQFSLEFLAIHSATFAALFKFSYGSCAAVEGMLLISQGLIILRLPAWAFTLTRTDWCMWLRLRCACA